jgi:hypothetical protein
MSEKRIIVGVWCGAGTELIKKVHELPLLKLTLRRSGGGFLLIPWTRDLDWLESETKGWGQGIRRCHTERRVAMRDLVAEMGADIGVLISGEIGSIDRAEVQLAIARLSKGWEKYETARVTAYPAHLWLSVSDDEEYLPKQSVEQLTKMLPPTDLEIRMARLKDRKQ